MAKPHQRKWTSLKYYVLSCLVLLATNSVFGQFFLQGGSSYWPDFDVPQLSRYNIPLRGDHDDGTLDRRADLWVGAGYRLDEAWSFEAFLSRLPSTEVSADLFSIFGSPRIVPLSLSISMKTDTTTVGFGAVYDLFINERVSLIGKAGVAFTQQEVEVGVSFPRFPLPPIYFEDDDVLFFFDEDSLFEDLESYGDYYEELIGDDESALDMYFAIGVRLPIQDSPGSVTATYQFISTPRDTQSGLYLGLCWEL